MSECHTACALCLLTSPTRRPLPQSGTQEAGPTLGSHGRGKRGQTSNNDHWSLWRSRGMWVTHPNASLPPALLPARSWRKVECL